MSPAPAVRSPELRCDYGTVLTGLCRSQRLDEAAECVNFAGVGPYVTMNPTRELAPKLDRHPGRRNATYFTIKQGG